MPISAVQQSDPVKYIHTSPFYIIFHHVLDIEPSYPNHGMSPLIKVFPHVPQKAFIIFSRKDVYIFFFFFLSFICYFFGPLPRHMEAPRLGVAPEPSRQPTPEPHPQPTPQLTATPDRQPTEHRQGPNPQPHGSQSDTPTTAPRRELPVYIFC